MRRGSVVAVMYVVMRAVVRAVVRQTMMMMAMMHRAMMNSGRSRTGDQRRHADNNGQGRENLTH